MAKNALATVGKKGKSFTDITAILHNPSDKAKLQHYIDDVIQAKTKILDQNETIKGLRDAAVEELGIEPKMFNSLVGLFFNNSFEQKREELLKLESAITALLGSADDE
jgi:hypothetical protein